MKRSSTRVGAPRHTLSAASASSARSTASRAPLSPSTSSASKSTTGGAGGRRLGEQGQLVTAAGERAAIRRPLPSAPARSGSCSKPLAPSRCGARGQARKARGERRQRGSWSGIAERKFAARIATGQDFGQARQRRRASC